MSEAAAVAWSAASAFAMESVGVFQIWETLGALGGSPAALAGLALAFAAGSLVSAWVLYKNLLATHPVDGRYAHAHF